jgi:hypothetical protein
MRRTHIPMLTLFSFSVLSTTAQSFLDVNAITKLLRDKKMDLPNDLAICKKIVDGANEVAKQEWEAMKAKYQRTFQFAKEVLYLVPYFICEPMSKTSDVLQFAGKHPTAHPLFASALLLAEWQEKQKEKKDADAAVSLSPESKSGSPVSVSRPASLTSGPSGSARDPSVGAPVAGSRKQPRETTGPAPASPFASTTASSSSSAPANAALSGGTNSNSTGSSKARKSSRLTKAKPSVRAMPVPAAVAVHSPQQAAPLSKTTASTAASSEKPSKNEPAAVGSATPLSTALRIPFNKMKVCCEIIRGKRRKDRHRRICRYTQRDTSDTTQTTQTYISLSILQMDDVEWALLAATHVYQLVSYVTADTAFLGSFVLLLWFSSSVLLPPPPPPLASFVCFVFSPFLYTHQI